MKCPSCGEVVEGNFQFCGNCVSVIPKPAAHAPVIAVAGSPLPESSILSDESASYPAAAPPLRHREEPASPPPPPAQVHKLIATAGLLSGRTFTIGPQGLLIGRDPANCQVVIADDEISRIHAWVGLD